VKANHSSGVGGIVGGLREKTTTTSYSGNFTSEEQDDGLLAGTKETIEIVQCTNKGNVYGYAFPAGIVGRTGSYTAITGCLNGENTFIIACRSTKPFPAGIVGSSYGVVSYCANLGTIASATWKDAQGTITETGGYYAAGIAGNLMYFTEIGGSGIASHPVPEVYGCYNAGQIIAKDNMRQRGLVGDNAGYVHDCVAETGLCYNDALVYGDQATDNESSGGTYSNIYVVSNGNLKNNTPFVATDKNGNSEETTVLSVLNTFGDKDGWGSYWVKSRYLLNSGYPVLNTQTSGWDLTSLENATVSLAANAEYTGLPTAPHALVSLEDGTTLVQGIDFIVVPDENGIEVTQEGETPYTATISGIGDYSGQAQTTLSYGVDKGDLANCTVIIGVRTFNWAAQMPSAEEVHVYNLAGNEIASSEYSYALDPTEENLTANPATPDDATKNSAVNAKSYNIIISASDTSHYFVGSS
jgi:hypothetical protein